MADGTKEITLPESGYKAILKTAISYGEFKRIQNTPFESLNLPTQKGEKATITAGFMPQLIMKIMTTVCVKLIDKEGNEKPLTEETLDELTPNDGILLEKECQEVLGDLKKKVFG